MDGDALLEAAIEEGVSFDPGRLFQTVHQDGLALRLCYSAVPAPDIEEGVTRLARALARLVA